MYFKRRDKEDNLYEQLQSRSLEMLQQLSGNRWTDYNEHDPGVTLLDVFNYALLEFKYRTDFPFEEYLVNPFSGVIDYPAMGLLEGNEIFAPSIVTPQDYENLMKQTLPAVKTCKVTMGADNLYGIEVSVHEGYEIPPVLQSIRELYHRNRNLCENLKEIQIVANGKNNGEKPCIQDIGYHSFRDEIPVSNRVHTDYHTIQHELPDCYCINRRGLPAGASEEQRAAARQLKSYMLIFDYMLSGMGQQTKNLHRLLELKEHTVPAFSMEMDVEDLKELLDRDKAAATELIHPEDFTARKSAYFDLLDAMYGEDSRLPLLTTKKQPEAHINKDRATRIRRFPELNTHRFKSFNLLDEKMESVPGITRLIATLQGCELQPKTVLTNVFSRYNIRLVSDSEFFTGTQNLLNIGYILDEQHQPIEEHKLMKIARQPMEYNERKFSVLRKHLNFFRNNVLFESFLEHGADIDNYRIYYVVENSTYLLLYQQPGQTEWMNMGLFFSEQRLVETLHYLIAFVEKLISESMVFYVVEHILLLQEEDKDQAEPNRLSIVSPQWTEHLYRRDSYEELIRERLPAHLEVNFCRLPVEAMYRFEQSYFPWRRAWTTDNKALINQYSIRIRTEISPNT